MNSEVNETIFASSGGKFIFGNLIFDFFKRSEYIFVMTTSYTNSRNPMDARQSKARPFLKNKQREIRFLLI